MSFQRLSERVEGKSRWVAGVVICLERGADLHMAQLMPLPLTESCFSRIQIGFTFLVLAHLGSPRKRAVKCVCVCVSIEDNQTKTVDKAPSVRPLRRAETPAR